MKSPAGSARRLLSSKRHGRLLRSAAFLTVAVICLALPSIVRAQLVDTAPRPIAVKNLRNTTAKGLEDLRGRLVLLEFFAHW